MKSIIITLLLGFTFTSAKAYITVKKSTQQLTIAEQVYNKLEVCSRLPYFTNRFIDRKSVNRPDIPSSIWQTIKDELDYTYFKELIIGILNNNFSNVEMQQMISDYIDKDYIPILHMKFRNEIQLALQNSNDRITNQINSQLISAGYQPL